MTLQEALSHKKLRRAEWEPGVYIEAISGGRGSLTMNNPHFSFQYTPILDDLLATDWEPYSPEPEKCKTCEEIEEIKKEHGLLRTPEINNFIWHLQKHHCTCKESL